MCKSRGEFASQKIAIIYDSRTGTTAKAAKYISEGIKEICETKIFSLSDVDMDYVKTCDGIILGSPTYFASLTANMKAWMEAEAPQLGLAGKLGGALQQSSISMAALKAQFKSC